MNNEGIKFYKSIVEEALNRIYLAKGIVDKRRRPKAIREAMDAAHDMVFPYKTILTNICHKECLNGELFDWGHIEGDLQDVLRILTELNNKNE